MTPNVPAETKALTKVLLQNGSIPAGQGKRLLPGLDVKLMIGCISMSAVPEKSVGNLSVRVLFGTPIADTGITILADSSVWLEETTSERDFIFTPATLQPDWIHNQCARCRTVAV
jgi:hypothetical protein